jgi:hypothetical protein
MAIHDVNDPPRLFLSEGNLVYLDGARVRTVDPVLLRWHLSQEINFYQDKNGNETPARPPNDLLQNLIVVPDNSLPVLHGVTRIPTFAPDGTLQTAPGYSPATKLVFAPITGLETVAVPTDPSVAELGHAVRYVLDDLLGDFPFADQSSRTHVLAALLLPFIRPMIDGPTPLHLITKPKAGTGATTMAETIGIVTCGTPSLQSLPTDEAERRRSLLAVLREDPGVVILDNVASLKGAALAACGATPDFQRMTAPVAGAFAN